MGDNPLLFSGEVLTKWPCHVHMVCFSHCQDGKKYVLARWATNLLAMKWGGALCGFATIGRLGVDF
jgi:hypothetical protein